MKTYQVIVGNVGTVYDGPSKQQALLAYHDYVTISWTSTAKIGKGRAAGEDVTLFINHDDKYTDILKEYKGHLSDNSDDL